MTSANLAAPTAQRHVRALGRYKHSLLLVTLLLLLLVAPAIDDDGAGGIALSALFTLVLLVSALAVGRGQRDLIIILGLTAPWLYLTWLHPMWSGSVLDEIAGVILAICTLYVAVVLLRSVLSAKRVTGDVISGAIAVYLLIGVAWAIIYALIEGASPGSFALADAGRGTIWDQLLYFSFATLTTLGYGDLAPLTPMARMWAVAEAICGTLFLAVLIARLVGSYSSDTTD